MKHLTCTALVISMFWATMASAQSVDSTPTHEGARDWHDAAV